MYTLDADGRAGHCGRPDVSTSKPIAISSRGKAKISKRYLVVGDRLEDIARSTG